MKTRTYTNRSFPGLLAVAAVICAPLLLATSANAEDWPLAGNWVVTVPTQAGNVILVQSILPQDETGTRFTSIMRQARENFTFFGIFPESEAATNYVGHIEKTGENTFEATFQKYATRKGDGPVADIVFIEVATMEGHLVDVDTMHADARVAIFAPEQDADEDGFPDPGEEPMICQEFTATGKRQKMMPPYELTPSPMPFCEYGTGIALQLGAGQGVWDQVWGSEAPGWYTCTAPMNVQFLGENVVGMLETADAGPPQIDGNMILRFTYGGQVTISKLAEAGSDEVVGQIKGALDGVFVVDLSAERATYDDDGNIVIPFGASLHDEPDIKIKVVEKTGVFADIKQVGTWRWYMTGEVTIARNPDIPLQQNIMAGLGDPALLIGADEEFVLTGWYYRTSQ